MRFGLLLLLLLFPASLLAQTRAPIDPSRVDSTSIGYKRAPLISAGLSWFVSGGGHFYNGEYRKGAMFAGAEVVLSGIFLVSAIAVVAPSAKDGLLILTTPFPVEREPTPPASGTVVAVATFTGLALASIKIWSIADSYGSSVRINQDIDLKRARLGAVRVEAAPMLVAGQLGASIRVQW